jgi:hypothetical protein
LKKELFMRNITAIAVFTMFSFLGKSQVKLLVDNTTVIQDNFLGVNVVHNGTTYMPPAQIGKIQVNANPPEFQYHPISPDHRAILLKRLKDSGVKMVRTSFQPWYACGQQWNGTYQWNSQYMTAFYQWLSDMQTNNIEVALCLGHYFPADVYNWNYAGHQHEDIAKKYAEWASEAIHQLIEIRGFTNIKYCLLFTEPQATPTQDFQYPSAANNWELYKSVCLAIDQELKASGRRNLLKLVGPNNFPKYSESPDLWLGKAVAELDSVLDIYSGHHYNLGGYAQWSKLCQEIKEPTAKTLKPFWIDEYGGLEQEQSKPAYGITLALAVQAFLNAGAQNSFLWQWAEDIYPSANPAWGHEGFSLAWGLMPNVAQNTTPKPAYYAFTLISKFFNNKNTKVFATQSANNVLLSAAESEGKNVSILLTNTSGQAQSFVINFKKPLAHTSFYRYSYNPSDVKNYQNAQAIPYDTIVQNHSNTIQGIIPDGSMYVYSTLSK